MAKTNVWCVRYIAGATGRRCQDSDSPQRRGQALATAKAVEQTGWHIWVEHEKTGKRIYDNRPAAQKGKG